MSDSKKKDSTPANPLLLTLSGERGAGKASIFHRLQARNGNPLSKMQGDAKEYLNSYGGRVHVAPIYIPLKLKDSTYYLNFALWEDFFSFNQSGIVYCVDSSDRSTIEEARESLDALLKITNELLEATQNARVDSKSVPLLVFANKQDINGAMTPKEVEDVLHLHNIKDRPYRVVGCSAVSGEGLKEGLEWLVKCRNTAKKRECMEDEVKETLKGPVKETLEDGKAVLKSGQSWLSSFFSKQSVKT